MKIKKGDFVARISHGKDIIFYVDKIIKLDNNMKIAILKGITARIIADSPISDLELMEKKQVENRLKILENENDFRTNIDNQTSIKNRSIRSLYEKIEKRNIINGKILHIDGDKKYSEKSSRYYTKMGLNVEVKNIAEDKQPLYIRELMYRHKPDIIVITGHDAMIKKQTGYHDIYNYRNSRYFVSAVEQVRKIDIENRIVVIAGACQSYYEALISAGANFASSPARILIDFLDPLIVASKVATTVANRYITIDDIKHDLRDGKKGIGGIGARGKKYIVT